MDRDPLKGVAYERIDARRRSVLFCVIASILVSICLVFTAVMLDAYRDVGRNASLSTLNLASSLAHNVDRDVEMLDQSLQAVTQSWIDPRVRTLQLDLRDKILFDNAEKAGGFGGMFVLDSSGIVRASSVASAPTDSLSTRDYFLVHGGNSLIGLYVSQPFVGRTSKEWSIGFSRRINNTDESFGGVVVGTLKLSYLDRLYKGVDLGPDGIVALLRTDGTIVSRTPYVQGDVHRNVRNSDAFSYMRSLEAGSLQGFSALDGKRHIISFHRVGNLPLIQVVEISASEAYAGWWRKAAVLAFLLCSLCAGCMLLLLLLGKELARRVKAEAWLERLARTDPLTLLANRRQFDEMLAKEWSRVGRAQLNLSLLMVDVDYFKRYNDRFGHPAGDEVLKKVAGCISGSVHRPADLACRVGGEEFGVLLPETDEAGALAVAETIRRAVIELTEVHPESSAGMVTVSIGTATARPRPTQSPQVLVATGDKALYLAKDAGRNCVRACPAPKHIALVA